VEGGEGHQWIVFEADLWPRVIVDNILSTYVHVENYQ
jgi:hypothetical protein